VFGCAALGALAAVACAGAGPATPAAPRTTPDRAQVQNSSCGPVMSGVALQPLVFGGTGVFAEENILYGLRLKDGHQQWRKVFPPTVTGVNAPFSDMVYGLWQWHGSVIVLVGQTTTSARLLSLNPQTGATHWTLPLRGGLLGTQALTGDGGLAMIRGYATLMVVNLVNGRVRWTRTAGHVAPAVVGGVVVAAVPARYPQPHGAVMGFDAKTGRLLWTRHDMPEQPSLAVAGEHVVVYDASQAVSPPVPLWPVTALSPATGRTLWRTAISQPVYMVLPGPSGLAVTTFSKSRLYLINPVTGHVRWSTSYLGSQQPPSDTGTDLLYTAGTGGVEGMTLVDLRAANGSVRWTAPAPATAWGTVLRFGPYAVVIGAPKNPGDAGVLAAFLLSTGKRAWTVTVPTLVQVPLVAAGGHLLAQPTDPAVGCAAVGTAAVGSGTGPGR
jgi:outer membrane protein assembly factor BamB